jgi:hypothetical protein
MLCVELDALLQLLARHLSKHLEDREESPVPASVDLLQDLLVEGEENGALLLAQRSECRKLFVSRLVH